MRSILPLALLLSACSASLHDPDFSTGSHTIVSDSSNGAVYAVDADNGAVVRQDVSTGKITHLQVGVEPSRIARFEHTLYVTLRGERAIAVVEDRDGVLTLVKKVATGTEPVGLVMREDGKRLYVALSTQGEVQELDGTTLEVLRSWSLEGQPTWLGLKPGGKALYVASAFGGQLTWINLENGEANPVKMRTHVGAGEDKDQKLTVRLTGDLSISSDGEKLAVPALYVDNLTPVEDIDNINLQVGGGYASAPSLVVSRFNPGIEMVPLNPDGSPNTEDSTTLFMAGVGLDSTVRSYINSATFSPDGMMVLGTMEASNTVVAASSAQMFRDRDNTGMDEMIVDSGGGFVTTDNANFGTPALTVVSTDAGPRGITFLDDEAYVHTFLDRTIGPLWVSQISSDLGEQFASGEVSATARAAPRGTSYGDSQLSSEVLAGRKLFYSATSSRMAADGAGVSCSTCHYDGRNDGLTWSFRSGGRQTPSLAGQVSMTEPMTWTAEVPSIADEATLTSQGRMGGEGLTRTDAENIQAFVDASRDVDLPMKGSADAAVLRGKAIFERADVGCSTCHSGSRYTDNDNHTMFGLTAVNTPGLVGIGATAPYLHDGSAETLLDVVNAAGNGEMGTTGMLSESEKADLVAYLKSL